MTKVERDFMRQVDELVLTATPEVLSKISEIDRKAQLSGLTFYDVYLQLSDEDRKQILIATSPSKKD